MPDEPEALGLQGALLLAHYDARRDARVDAHGALVLLDEQDRAPDRPAIGQATRLATRGLRLGPADRYVLQAAIGVEHTRAPPPRTPDGSASPSSTSGWPRLRAIRSSSSIARRRSGRQGTLPADCRRPTRSRARWTATTTSMPHVPNCSAASARATRLPAPTPAPWSWRAMPPSARPRVPARRDAGVRRAAPRLRPISAAREARPRLRPRSAVGGRARLRGPTLPGAAGMSRRTHRPEAAVSPATRAMAPP